jgi:hypothetical protein
MPTPVTDETEAASTQFNDFYRKRLACQLHSHRYNSFGKAVHTSAKVSKETGKGVAQGTKDGAKV